MPDISTQYLGLKLRNPFIVGSCSLTASLKDIVELEEHGAGAVVLNSIFEEEILQETDFTVAESNKNSQFHSNLSATMEYVDSRIKEKRLANYLRLIHDAKKETSIPIIASINCMSGLDWTVFTKKIQEAGADALELNLFTHSMNAKDKTSIKENQKIIAKVLKAVNIPVTIKLDNSYTHIIEDFEKIAQSGIAGLVLFNKHYLPDVDIYNCCITDGRILSSQEDYRIPLRWIALLSGKVKCSLAASTGIYDGNTAVKQILAGADAVQVVSTLYLNGKKQINAMVNELSEWMDKKGYFSIEQFKGKAAFEDSHQPVVYERIQLMKKYGRIG